MKKLRFGARSRFFSCRTCKDPVGGIHPLEERVKLIGNDYTFGEMLEEVVNINRNFSDISNRKDDYLPKFLCNHCVEKLKNAYEFINQARKVNEEYLTEQNVYKKDESYMADCLLEQEVDLSILDDEIKVKSELGCFVSSEKHNIEQDEKEADAAIKSTKPVDSEFHYETICDDGADCIMNDSSEYDKKSQGYQRKPCVPLLSKFEIDRIQLRRGRVTRNSQKFIERNNKYVCDVCNASFFQPSQLKVHKRSHCATNHLQKHSNIPGTDTPLITHQNNWTFGRYLYDKDNRTIAILCKLCNANFVKIRDLRKHLTLHSETIPNENLKQYQKIFTISSTKSLEEVADLIRNDILEKKFTIYFEILNQYCYEMCLNDSDIDDDERCVGEEEEEEEEGKRSDGKADPYECELCSLHFVHKNDMYEHVLQKHRYAAKPYRCNVCKTEFVNLEIFLYHERTQCRNRDRKYKCSNCPAKFVWLFNLQKHKCSNRPTQIFDLHDHGSYSCDNCSESFESFVDLKRHSFVHDSVAPAQSSSPSKIGNGEKIAQGEKKPSAEVLGWGLQCEECGKAFVWPKDLKRHRRVHLPESEKLECEVCGKKFNRADNLRSHLKVHGIKRKTASRTAVKKKKTNNASTVLMKIPEIPEDMCKPHGCKTIQCKLCLSKHSRIVDLRAHLPSHQNMMTFTDRTESTPILYEEFYGYHSKLNMSDEKTLMYRINHDLDHNRLDHFYSITNEFGYELSIESSETETENDADNDDDNSGAVNGDNDSSDDEPLIKKKLKLCGKYTCDKCKMSFNRKYKAFHHQRTAHSYLKLPHSCTHCNSRFISESLLDWHLDRQCENKRKRFPCKKCPMRFTWKENMENHMLVAHLQFEKPPLTMDFECKECPRKFSMQKDLSRHITFSHSSTSLLLKCLFCPRNFIKTENLMRHIARHGIISSANYTTAQSILQSTLYSNGSKQIVCKSCNATFRKISALRDHFQVGARMPHLDTDASCNSGIACNGIYSITNALGFEMHIDDSETESEAEVTKYDVSKSVEKSSESGQHSYTCTLCNLVCQRKYKMSKHQHSIHKYESLPLKCNKCIFRTACEEILTHHKRTQCENNEKLETCPHCHFKFEWPENLARHIQLQHADEDSRNSLVSAAARSKSKNDVRFPCDKCCREYSRRDLLKDHMKKVHSNRAACDGTAAGENAAKAELNSKKKTSQSKSLCPFCGISVSSSNLVIHIRRHTGEKPYKCDFCERGFARSTDLQTHRRRHTGEKPHVCTVCGSAFARSHKLKLHIRVHSGEKPYKCTYQNCSKAFAQLHDLRLHVRRHTGEKPYVCKICGEGFIQGSALKNHRIMKGHVEVDDMQGFLRNQV